MDQYFFFDYLLSFKNESFLKCFYLLLHFIHVWVSSFKVSATMDIERIFKFFRESLDFEFLFNQFGLEFKDLIFVSWDAVAFFHKDLQFPFEVLLFVFEQFKIRQSLSEGSLSFGQSGLLDLNLFIQQSRLIVSSYQLSTEDVSFCNNQLVLIFSVLSLVFGLLDCVVKFGDFVETVLNFLPSFVHLFFLFLELSAVFQKSLIFFLVLKMFFSQSDFLGLYLLFQLVNLVINDFISSLQFCDFILCF